MSNKLKKLLRDESGITALETAIILIAFVVVASVFAFTIMSAGTFATEKSRQAVYGGLEQVGSSMEVYGSVIASRDVSVTTEVGVITFTLASVAGGEGINITDTTSTQFNEVVISYRDDDESVSELDWRVSFIGTDDGDWLLEEGELAEITVDLQDTDNDVVLGPNDEFQIEVKPPQGGVVPIMRTAPASFDPVMVLD